MAILDRYTDKSLMPHNENIDGDVKQNKTFTKEEPSDNLLKMSEIKDSVGGRS